MPLTDTVLQLLGAPAKSGFVFSTTGGNKPFSGFSKAKRALDQTVAEQRKAVDRDAVPHWVLHDLRRTARSLMSSAGVSPDIAERVIGHVIQVVRGVYDRHAYIAEKRDALERLARLRGRRIGPGFNGLRAEGEIDGARTVAAVAATPVHPSTPL